MPEADTAFIPLADLLRPPVIVRTAVVPDVSDVPEVSEGSGERKFARDIARSPAASPETAFESSSDARASALMARDVRVFRAQLADAFDAARDTMLRDLAFTVLGRELLIGDADVAAIVARVIAEHPDAQPLRVHVAACDLPNVAEHIFLPLIANGTLESGDAIVELTCGSIDARLGVRVAALLERAS